MNLTDRIRASLRNRTDHKAEQAKHRMNEVAAVVAIVDRKDQVPVTVVLPKYERTVRELKAVVTELRKDYTKYERHAKTCGINNTFTFVNRLTGESVVVSSFNQAEPLLHQLTKDTFRILDAINAFEPHPDYKVMRRSAKALARSAA